MAVVAVLREAGVPLGVVSNANGQIEGTIANLNLCQVGPGGGVPVEIVVDSAVAGVEKPDPAIFAPAIDAVTARGAARDRIAYVGGLTQWEHPFPVVGAVATAALSREAARAAAPRADEPVREQAEGGTPKADPGEAFARAAEALVGKFFAPRS